MVYHYKLYLDFDLKYDVEKDEHYNDDDEYYTLLKYLETIYITDQSDNYDKLDKNKYNDMEFNVIRDFHYGILLDLITRNFRTRDICYKGILHREVYKYICHIWKKYDKIDIKDIPYPESQLKECIDTIKQHLIETSNLTQEEYDDILCNPKNKKYDSRRNYRYYSWWLYGYLPLFENGEKLIMKIIEITNIDDAQDVLLDSIYDMEPCRLNKFIKPFLLKLHEQRKTKRNGPCFEMWCNGTGAGGQMVNIFKKLYNAGYNLFMDKELDCIFYDEKHKKEIHDTII